MERLASRNRPLDEAAQLAERVDVDKHPVVVVLGFGLGYHVKAICERMGTKGVVVVYEPDLQLLRSVFENIDCTWMGDANLLIFHDADDTTAIAKAFRGMEGLLAQGVQVCDHPPSRARLGDGASRFAQTVSRYIDATKTSVVTTLVQMGATLRNTLANLRQYAVGDGIADLHGLCQGKPAIVVSAGPSLAKNIHLLEDPQVQDRCVILCVQTVLKTLLARGIRPHFVGALDYHELSKRFFEGLGAEDVRGVQLVCEAKVNPAVIDTFPGPIRCVTDQMLDHLLGDEISKDMGSLDAGATVAHLCFYMAQYLGCEPLIFIGQDLGFTDGLYYAAGNPIHDVWAPELNEFNTLEMMEHQRIVRMKSRSRFSMNTDEFGRRSVEDVPGQTERIWKVDGQDGRRIYTDEQMHTYQEQFQRDFLVANQTVIDATEGGTRKQGVTTMTLREALDQYMGDPLPVIPLATMVESAA